MKIICLIVMVLAIGLNIYTNLSLMRQYAEMQSNGTAYKWQSVVVYSFCAFSGYLIGECIILIYDCFQQ